MTPEPHQIQALQWLQGLEDGVIYREARHAVESMVSGAVANAVFSQHLVSEDWARILLCDHWWTGPISNDPALCNAFLQFPLWRERSFQSLSYELQTICIIRSMACLRFLASHTFQGTV